MLVPYMGKCFYVRRQWDLGTGKRGRIGPTSGRFQRRFTITLAMESAVGMADYGHLAQIFIA